MCNPKFKSAKILIFLIEKKIRLFNIIKNNIINNIFNKEIIKDIYDLEKKFKQFSTSSLIIFLLIFNYIKFKIYNPHSNREIFLLFDIFIWINFKNFHRRIFLHFIFFVELSPQFHSVLIFQFYTKLLSVLIIINTYI